MFRVLQMPGVTYKKLSTLVPAHVNFFNAQRSQHTLYSTCIATQNILHRNWCLALHIVTGLLTSIYIFTRRRFKQERDVGDEKVVLICLHEKLTKHQTIDQRHALLSFEHHAFSDHEKTTHSFGSVVYPAHTVRSKVRQHANVNSIYILDCLPQQHTARSKTSPLFV